MLGHSGRRWRFVGFLLLTLVLPLCSRAAVTLHAPGLADLGLSPQNAADLADNDLLLIEQHPRDVQVSQRRSTRRHYQVHFVTGLMVINLPTQQLINDFHNPALTTQLFPNTTKMQPSSAAQAGEYWLYQNYPLPLFTWHVALHMHQWMTTPNQWLTELIDGDVDASLNRWEIYALDSSRSLVVFTDWTNIEPTNWLYQLVLKAQGDIRAALPWLVVSSTLESLRRHYDPPKGPPSSPLPEFPAPPEPPSLDYYGSLLKSGNMARISGRLWFQDNGNPRPIQFVSVSQPIDAPPQTSQQLLSQFSRYDEFLKPVQSVSVSPTPFGMETTWRLRANLGLFNISSEYHVIFWRKSPSLLYFYRERGAQRQFFGSFEFNDNGERGTLCTLTTGAENGGNASWLLGYMRYAPFPEINGPLLGSLLTLRKGAPWVEKQLSAANKPPH